MAKKTQHAILREMFAKEGTSLPIDEIAKRLGTTPVSAVAAMATLRNPKRQAEPFVITRIPKTQDYGRGKPVASEGKKKKVAAKKKVAKTGKRKPKGVANGPVAAAA